LSMSEKRNDGRRRSETEQDICICIYITLYNVNVLLRIRYPSLYANSAWFACP